MYTVAHYVGATEPTIYQAVAAPEVFAGGVVKFTAPDGNQFTLTGTIAIVKPAAEQA